MPRVVLLLLLTLVVVTLYCARRGGDGPLQQSEPADEIPGLNENLDTVTADATAELYTEDAFGPYDNSLYCGPDIERYHEVLAQWLAQYPPESWGDPPDAVLEEPLWVRAPELPQAALRPPAWTSGFVSVPPMLAERCRPARGHILNPGASSEAGERAVAWGLQWLARQQKKDGGWEFDGTDADDRVAATGLALLAFLGSGYTHTGTLAVEPDEREPLVGKCGGPRPRPGYLVARNDGPYQMVVRRGLEFLLARCLPHGASRGAMSRNTQSHAIATLALCEAHAMTRDNRLLLVATQAAVYHLARTQGPGGGWGFTPGASEDMLVVGWVVQAFHTAQAGNAITVPRDTVKGIGRFLDHTSAGPHRSAYGTADPRDAAPGTAATATGLLARLLIGDWALDNRGLATGLTGLEQRVPNDRATLFDVEFCYYATLTFRLFEGSEWLDWMEGQKHPDGVRRRGLRTELANLQVQKEGPDRGRFNPAAGWVGQQWGRLGTTALCLLTLESPYRQGPLSKESNPRN